jgi:UDP-N-acetylglucosamine:LPS N-acetylglucosamine transferase
VFAQTNGSSSATVSVLENPDSISDIMADTLVGITNGGTTLMEFTMLGVPAIVFPQSEQEDRFVYTFLEKGSAVMGSSRPDEFAEQITALWDDEIMRKTMSGNARELIDGLGAERITELVLNTFQKGEY